MFKDFFDEISGDSNEYDFGIDNELCQYMKELHNPVNQYFPNAQLQNHAKLEDSFKIQDRPMSFNVTV